MKVASASSRRPVQYKMQLEQAGGSWQAGRQAGVGGPAGRGHGMASVASHQRMTYDDDAVQGAVRPTS